MTDPKAPKYRQVEEIFEEKPLEQFFHKHKGKLPKDLPKEVRKKLLQDAKFFSELGVTTQAPKKASFGIPTITLAYPNYDQYQYIEPPRDTQKWIQAMREIYFQVYKGADKNEATQKTISKWDEMEQFDFKNWMRFYEEGAHLKYKTAQNVSYWEDANRAGYFVPIHREPQPPTPTQVMNPASNPDVQSDEKRQVIEKQRQKIIGRLDSAEKLLRSHEGQMFAGKELETLLDAIYQLKKKIHMVNKISLSTRLYEDMIIREANRLTKQGFTKAGQTLYKVAQEMPVPAEPANPIDNGGLPGLPGTLPGSGPGLTPEMAVPTDTAAPTDPGASASPAPSPPGIAAGKTTPLGTPGGSDIASPTDQAMPPMGGLPTEAPISPGMQGFLEGLDSANETFDAEEDEDHLEVSESDDLTVKEAQMAPPPEPMPPAEAPSAKVGPDPAIEVSEDQMEPDVPEDVAVSNVDGIWEKALSNTTIQDVIAELDEVSKIFQNREISRRIARVDIMLDHLGLAAFFPTLSEVAGKSNESNTYMRTRVDEILSKLRGAIESKPLDLTEQGPGSPQTQPIAQNLQQQIDKDKSRKQMRKDLADQALMEANKPTPEIEVAEDLGAEPATPVPGPAPAPAPAAPIAPAPGV